MLRIGRRNLEQDKLDAKMANNDWLVQRYEEANALYRQENYRAAITKYDDVISNGAKTEDPMVLKMVSAALRLCNQCQFHLWQSLHVTNNVKSTSRRKQTNQFGQRSEALLEQKKR